MNKLTLRTGKNLGIGYDAKVVLTLISINDNSVDLAVKSEKEIPVYLMEDHQQIYFQKLDQKFQKARDLLRRRAIKKPTGKTDTSER